MTQSASVSGTLEHVVEGAADSSVRVVVYEDLQCSDCDDFRKALDQHLLPRYQSKAAFEYRDFPLTKHEWARKAAIASRFVFAAKPESAVDFRRYLMAHLGEITAENFNDVFARYAKEHGIDPTKALAALDEPCFAAEVQADVEDGVARGISRTPSVLVNYYTAFIMSFTWEEVAEAIDSELAAVE